MIPPPTLTLHPALPSDIPLLAHIYRLAFSPGKLYTSLFSVCSPTEIETRMGKRFAKWIADPRSEVLKVINAKEEIVGFAFWDLPEPVEGWPREAHEQGPRKLREFSEGTRVEVARDFFARLDAHEETLPKRSFHLQMLATDPRHQRTGAGRLLLEQLAVQADKEGVEVHLDATEEGLPVYPRFGYEIVGKPLVASDGSFKVQSMVRKAGVSA